MTAENAETKPTVLGGVLLAIVIALIGAVLYGVLFGEDDAQPADLTPYTNEVTRLAAICDNAQDALGAAMESAGEGGAMNLARVARTMDENCTISWLGMKEVEAPDGLTGEQRRAIRTIEQECSLAFYTRSELAKSIGPMIDGGAGAGAMVQLERDVSFTNSQRATCAEAVGAVMKTPPDSAP